MTRAANLANFADETILTVDGVNNRVGIGSTQPTEKLDVVGVVSATSFFGSGANLTGITAGATLSAGSGDQKVVLTSKTAGQVMTTAGIDAELTYNSGTNTLSATTFSGNATGLTGTPNITINNLVGVAATFTGVLTYEDVTNIDSLGIITARSDVSIADKIIHTGDTNTAIRFPAVDTFTVETAGSERLRIDSSGFVGVNTDSPGRQLTVSGGSAEGVIQITNNTSGAAGGNGFELLHFTSGETQLLNRENGAMRFDTNGTERLRILSDGTVGTGGLSATPGTVAAGSIISANANAGFFANGYDGKFGTASNHPVYIQVNGSSKLTIATDGTISDSIGPLRRLGQSIKSGNYTLVAGDAGTHIRVDGAHTITVPDNVFTAGDMVTIVANSSSNVPITQGSGLNLYNASDGTTGSKTQAARTVSTILFAEGGSGSKAYISGGGLS